MDNKYENGKIYKITSANFDKYYIGSTTESLKNRLSKHLDNWKLYKNGDRPEFITSFLLFQAGDYKIELIEEYPCDSKKELHEREGHHQKKCKDEIVNKNIAGRSAIEWRKDNSEKLKEYFKKHYIDNKEKHNEYYRDYYVNNKDKVCEANKKWRSENRDQKSKIDKAYYENNKANIRATMSAKEECECGGSYQRSNRARHMKSKQHIVFMDSL
ncbi:MAG: hypothetical protein P4L31_03230 [Candidatus Babeliales bacterium]|nr:hypothetical protein [Candidatus Babeliales bacterium]